MNAITHDRYAELRSTVQPESLAVALGHPAHRESDVGGPAMSCLQRFPRSFLRMLRQAMVAEAMSPAAAASFAGLSVLDIARLISLSIDGREQNSPPATEFHEFEITGVI